MKTLWVLFLILVVGVILLAECGPAATATPVPPVATQIPPTNRPVQPTPTLTPLPVTATPLLPTVTQIPPTDTPQPLPASTPQPPPSPTQPLGGLIVFYSERGGDAEIYVMNSDGSDQRPLTNNNADDFSPSWSPDGTGSARIVFESDRDDPRPRACFPNCN